MFIQLEDGTTTEMSIEQYLAMSDDRFNEICRLGKGDVINDAFFGSVLERGENLDPEIYDEIVPDLVEIPIGEKLTDPEFIKED